VPLELLVQRDGVDSLLGATQSNLRVPSFLDDVISTMREMGEIVSRNQELLLTLPACRYVRGRHLREE
jgi:hypothetical protein